MLDYKAMRALLKASPEHIKLKHFTEAFYKTFCDAWKRKDWAEVYTTDFYNLESYGYCAFLEVFNSSLPRWRLTFGKMEAGWSMDFRREYIHEDTEADAKEQGNRMLQHLGADYVDVILVKGTI